MGLDKNKSMVDIAYDYLKKAGKKASFSALYNYVCKELEFSEKEKTDKIAGFYTNLTLDGRFCCLEKNFWDLRENLTLKDTNAEIVDPINNNEDNEDKSNRETSDEDDDEEDLEELDEKPESELKSKFEQEAIAEENSQKD